MTSELVKTAVIVEDDPQTRHLLAEVFESAGFSTVSVGNGLDGVRAVVSYQPLVTTLDVAMPGIDGFEAARRIRAQSDTYIIMLTGLGEETDVVLGLASGADEYLTKPFSPRELRARIEAIVRRRQQTLSPTSAAVSASEPQQDKVGPSFPTRTAPTPVDETPVGRPHPVREAPPQVAPSAPLVVTGTGSPSTEVVLEHDLPADRDSWLRHRDLQLDPESHLVVLAGRELALTPTEFDLLATLMHSKRRVRSKSDLTLVLRGESYVTSYFVGDADKRAIEAHMTNLRRKLGDDATTPRYIETVRGVGYRMTSEAMAS